MEEENKFKKKTVYANAIYRVPEPPSPKPRPAG